MRNFFSVLATSFQSILGKKRDNNFLTCLFYLANPFYGTHFSVSTLKYVKVIFYLSLFVLCQHLCGPDYNEFLCYMLAPPCSSPRKPCRSLCLAVENECGKVMQSFGHDWPEAFKCDPFPTDNCLGQKEAQNTKFLNGTGKPISRC